MKVNKISHRESERKRWMFGVRYYLNTGLVNLVGDIQNIVPIDGHGIMELDEMPPFNGESEHLYVKDGKIVAVKI